MRRLDEVLTDLAENPEPKGADRVVERLRASLAGEAEIIPLTRDPADEPESKRRRWRGPLVAVAALAAALLIAVPLLLLGGRDTPTADTIEEPATTAPAPTTTATPTTTAPVPTSAPTSASTTLPAVATTVTPPPLPPTPVALSMTWTEAVGQADLESGWMQAVAVGGPGLVAVGSTEDLDAAVWVSEDAETWHRIESDTFLAGDGSEAAMSDVAASNGVIVAVGAATDRPMSWRSADGETWDPIDLAPDVEGYGFVGLVIHTGDGFLAMGFLNQAQAIWVSEDGADWTVHDDPGFEIGLDGKPFWVADIARGGPGFVAVGAIQHLDDTSEWIEMRSIAWTSPDGLSWTLLPDDAIAGAAESQMYFVDSAGDGLVATGEGFDGPRVWYSDDGLTWRVTDELITPDGNLWASIRPVVATADGRLAGAGTEQSLVGAPPWITYAVFWASDDGGATWYRVGRSRVDSARAGLVDAGSQPWHVSSDMVEFDGRYVVVGHRGVYFTETIEEHRDNFCSTEWTGSCRTDAAVWIGTWDR